MIIDTALLSFSDKEIELYEKYNVSFSDGKRIYELDLNERRYDLTSSSPYRLNLMIDDNYYMLNDTSWSTLLFSLFVLLQSKKPLPLGYLTSIELDWSSTSLFSYSKTKVASKFTPCGLYIYCGFIATHSFWVIRELLRLYKINRATLFIFRLPLSEPEEISRLLTNKRKTLFKQYLSYFNKEDDLEIEQIVTAIDSFNVLLTRKGYGYQNLYLIDNSDTLSNYTHKLLDDIRKETEWRKKIDVAEEYLQLFCRFANYVRPTYAAFGQSYKSFNRCQYKASPIKISKPTEENIEIKRFVRFADPKLGRNETKKPINNTYHVKEDNRDNADLTVRYKNVTKSVLNIVSKSSVPLKAIDIANYLVDGTDNVNNSLKKEFPYSCASYRGIFKKNLILKVIDEMINKSHLICDSNGFLQIKQLI